MQEENVTVSGSHTISGLIKDIEKKGALIREMRDRESAFIAMLCVMNGGSFVLPFDKRQKIYTGKVGVEENEHGDMVYTYLPLEMKDAEADPLGA